MALYLLDKNIVEDIRGSLNGIRSPGVMLARSIDRKGNIVSPLLAILEGGTRGPQATAECHDSLVRNTQAVGMFYRYARTDAKFLIQNSVEMIITLGTHFREKATNLMPLAGALQALLARTYSIVDARDILQKIDTLSRAHSVEHVHPLITCAVACLYGHAGARKVLKPRQDPTEGDSYNAVVDVRMLMEAAYIHRMWQKHRPWEKVHLFSRDKSLNDFAKIIAIVADGSAQLDNLSLELVSFTSTISGALFPNLEKDPREMERILSYLRETRERRPAWT